MLPQASKGLDHDHNSTGNRIAQRVYRLPADRTNFVAHSALALPHTLRSVSAGVTASKLAKCCQQSRVPRSGVRDQRQRYLLRRISKHHCHMTEPSCTFVPIHPLCSATPRNAARLPRPIILHRNITDSPRAPPTMVHDTPQQRRSTRASVELHHCNFSD